MEIYPAAEVGETDEHVDRRWDSDFLTLSEIIKNQTLGPNNVIA